MKQQLDTGPAGARASIESLAQSKIREVANAGMDLENLITLWYGEPDLPTPDFICQAASRALADGHTFYTQNLGIDPLREALAGYMTGLYEKPVEAGRIAVTASAMAACNLVQQVLTNPGDNMVIVAPIWPNLIETVRIMSGEPRFVHLQFGNDGWQLDLQALFDQVDSKTRAIMINSPNNPTGWILDRDEQQAILDFARERGLWVIADEVYARLVYDLPRGRQAAPSFIDIAEADDRLIVVNSFSKTWCMTGWRLGWLTVPEGLIDTLEKMIEFHYSCPAHFSQVAAVTAIEDGEDFVHETVARYQRCRDIMIDALATMPGIRIVTPPGAFYGFFEVDGMTDSVAVCKKIIAETNVGLAPGAAFGDQYDQFIRLCFASSEDRLTTAMTRLGQFFG